MSRFWNRWNAPQASSHTVPYTPPAGPPPGWQPAPERPHTFGLYNEATDDSYKAAVYFCATNPVDPPRYLSPADLEKIAARGCGAWELETPLIPNFVGRIEKGNEKSRMDIIHVSTENRCKDTCLLSDLPLSAGLYDLRGKEGFYYEITVLKMQGVIAIGTACKPHPEWRLPGWERLSAGLHLDDCRKFFEDPTGGREYMRDLVGIRPGDVIGCGHHYSSGAIFFTYNGQRLSDAFTGVYLPRARHDVYAAIGVDGENEFVVNFGGDYFRWLEGNEWQWKIDGHSAATYRDEELPSYDAIRGDQGRSYV